MSLDIDALFTQQQGPLSPLGFSATSSMVDFSSIYDLPAQTSLSDKTAFTDMMGGSCEDICSPVFTKMDPNGCELLSLDDLSNSEFGYLNSDGTCAVHLSYVFMYLSICSQNVTVVYITLFFSSFHSTVANSLDQDWLIEPVSLPSPEEQDGDIKYSSLPTTTTTPAIPPQSLPLAATTQFCLNSSSPLSASATSCMLTPDPSLPPSPNSILSYSSEEEEIQDVLASFNNESSCLDIPAPIQPFAPTQMLPFDCSSQLLDVASPSSCLMSAPSSPEDESRSSFDGICGMLNQNESSSRSLSLPSLAPLPHSTESVSGRTEQSRKRKSLPISSDQQSSAPAPASKRRMTKASKKERKREQNKTAALRYRQKKKGEKVDIEVQRAELEDKNKKLKAQVTSLSNEINYLKKLWLEIRERKGQKS